MRDIDAAVTKVGYCVGSLDAPQSFIKGAEQRPDAVNFNSDKERRERLEAMRNLRPQGLVHRFSVDLGLAAVTDLDDWMTLERSKEMDRQLKTFEPLTEQIIPSSADRFTSSEAFHIQLARDLRAKWDGIMADERQSLQQQLLSVELNIERRKGVLKSELLEVERAVTLTRKQVNEADQTLSQLGIEEVRRQSAATIATPAQQTQQLSDTINQQKQIIDELRSTYEMYLDQIEYTNKALEEFQITQEDPVRWATRRNKLLRQYTAKNHELLRMFKEQVRSRSTRQADCQAQIKEVQVQLHDKEEEQSPPLSFNRNSDADEAEQLRTEIKGLVQQADGLRAELTKQQKKNYKLSIVSAHMDDTVTEVRAEKKAQELKVQVQLPGLQVISRELLEKQICEAELSSKESLVCLGYALVSFRVAALDDDLDFEAKFLAGGDPQQLASQLGFDLVSKLVGKRIQRNDVLTLIFDPSLSAKESLYKHSAVVAVAADTNACASCGLTSPFDLDRLDLLIEARHLLLALFISSERSDYLFSEQATALINGMVVEVKREISKSMADLLLQEDSHKHDRRIKRVGWSILCYCMLEASCIRLCNELYEQSVGSDKFVLLAQKAVNQLSGIASSVALIAIAFITQLTFSESEPPSEMLNAHKRRLSRGIGGSLPERAPRRTSLSHSNPHKMEAKAVSKLSISKDMLVQVVQLHSSVSALTSQLGPVAQCLFHDSLEKFDALLNGSNNYDLGNMIQVADAMIRKMREATNSKNSKDSGLDFSRISVADAESLLHGLGYGPMTVHYNHSTSPKKTPKQKVDEQLDAVRLRRESISQKAQFRRISVSLNSERRSLAQSVLHLSQKIDSRKEQIKSMETRNAAIDGELKNKFWGAQEESEFQKMLEAKHKMIGKLEHFITLARSNKSDSQLYEIAFADHQTRRLQHEIKSLRRVMNHYRNMWTRSDAAVPVKRVNTARRLQPRSFSAGLSFSFYPTANKFVKPFSFSLTSLGPEEFLPQSTHVLSRVSATKIETYNRDLHYAEKEFLIEGTTFNQRAFAPLTASPSTKVAYPIKKGLTGSKFVHQGRKLRVASAPHRSRTPRGPMR